MPTCRELGIGFVAYSPLGRGFLTGQLKHFEDLAPDDFRRILPRFQRDKLQNNLKLVKKLEKIAQEKGCTGSQLALAWLLAQGDDIVPIPGTKRRKYLQENIKAENIQVTAEDTKRINKISQNFVGTRYTEVGMLQLNL